MKVWLVWDGGDREASPVAVFSSEAEANTFAEPLTMRVLGPWEVDAEKPVVHPPGTRAFVTSFNPDGTRSTVRCYSAPRPEPFVPWPSGPCRVECWAKDETEAYKTALGTLDSAGLRGMAAMAADVWIVRWAEELEGNPGRVLFRDFLVKPVEPVPPSLRSLKPVWSVSRAAAWEFLTPDAAYEACLRYWPAHQIDSAEGPAIIGQRPPARVR